MRSVVPWFVALAWSCGVAGRVQAQAPQLIVDEFPAMGTKFGIKFYAEGEDWAKRAKAAVARARERVVELEAVFSDYDAESEVMRLVSGPVGKPAKISADLMRVLKLSAGHWKQSGGAFDITVGPHTWNWRMSQRTKRLPDREAIASARAATGFSHLSLDARARTLSLDKAGMRLDFGGIAKGFAADEALAILEAHGFKRALVAASGDVVAGAGPPGTKGWRVAVQSLQADSGKPATAFLFLEHAAVSTSGDVEQSLVIEGKRYSHIVDPSTGLGLTKRIGVSVVSRRGASSDACATAASIMGAERGLRWLEKLGGVEGLVIDEGDRGLRERKTPGFPRLWKEDTPRQGKGAGALR